MTSYEWLYAYYTMYTYTWLIVLLYLEENVLPLVGYV